MSEQDIWHELVRHKFGYLDAIEALERYCDYLPKEAERLVNEWLDGLEDDEPEYD